MLHILCIGDVVGSIGCQFLRSRLPALKKTKAIDLVIANGENSAGRQRHHPRPPRSTCSKAAWT